jgi:hypothetical protein
LIAVTDETGERIEDDCECGHSALEHLRDLGDGWFELEGCQCGCRSYVSRLYLTRA